MECINGKLTFDCGVNEIRVRLNFSIHSSYLIQNYTELQIEKREARFPSNLPLLHEIAFMCE